MTTPAAIEALMNRYDEYLAKWLSQHDSDYGYDLWFTRQVLGETDGDLAAYVENNG